MAKFVEIEQLLKTFLVANGFTSGNIFLQEFPASSSRDGVYLLRRVGSGDLPDNLNIDVPLVRVWARHTNPQTAFLNQKSVGDLIKGLNSTVVGTATFLFGQIQAGPEIDDDTELDVRQWAATYLIRVVVP